MKLDNSAQISQNEPHVMRKLIIINEQVFAFCAWLLWLTLFTLCTLFTWIFTGYCCAHPSHLMPLILVLLVKNHLLSYFFVKKIPLSRRDAYVWSMG